MTTVKRIGLPTLLSVLLAAAGTLLLVLERPSVGDESWRQLSLSGFVQEITQITEGDEPVSDETWAAIRSQSTERLLAAVQTGAAEDYGDLVALYLWSKPNLTTEQDATVLASLTPSANQTSSWAFSKLKTVHARMTEAEMPIARIEALPVSWLEGRDLQTITDVDELSWLHERVHTIGRTETAATGFTAEWTGNITAPASGECTFSVCPLELNFQHGRRFRTQTTTVTIAGRKVLDTADGESVESTPVVLTAGQQTSIRVNFTYDASDWKAFYSSPAVATLFWKAPGGDRTVVPERVLSTSSGEAGLDARYVIEVDGQDATTQRVDANIDFVWYHGSQIAPAELELRTSLGDRLLAVARSSLVLARWETEKAAGAADWPGANWAMLESLGAEASKQWADTLLAHPVLLSDTPRSSAVNLYRSCRFGSADLALELFGRWASDHADEVATLSADFFADNRSEYRNIANMLAWQSTDQLESLEENYLTLPDGSCSLPVAYALSYAYWTLGNTHQWIEKLDVQLDGDELTGDVRASWLLARAQAEEIRLGRPGRFSRTTERSLAGLQWLQEAVLVASSEPVRLRAHLEIAARFAEDEHLEGAGQTLSDASQRCTSTASAAAIAQWQSGLETLQVEFQQRREAQESLAQDAYINRLRLRRQNALDAGDSAAVSRYEQLLADTGSAD